MAMTMTTLMTMAMTMTIIPPSSASSFPSFLLPPSSFVISPFFQDSSAGQSCREPSKPTIAGSDQIDEEGVRKLAGRRMEGGWDDDEEEEQEEREDEEEV